LGSVGQDRNLKPKAILNQEHLQHHNKLSYQQAWRTKEKALKAIEGNQSEQFALLPRLCTYLQSHDKDGTADFELYPDQSFHRLFIAPGALRKSYGRNLRPLIGVDATFTTSRKSPYP
jgi:hypothetical protein